MVEVQKSKTQKPKKDKVLLNEEIPFSEFLLVSKEGKRMVSRKEGLEIAERENLDLFCVSPNSEPRVCKLVDYQKIRFLEGKKKKKKEQENKEVRVSANISPNDLQIKLDKVIKWLREKNAAVKIVVRILRGRSVVPNFTTQRCKDIISSLKEQVSNLELRKDVHQEGRNLSFTLCQGKRQKQEQENNS